MWLQIPSLCGQRRLMSNLRCTTAASRPWPCPGGPLKRPREEEEVTVSCSGPYEGLCEGSAAPETCATHCSRRAETLMFC
jgi:hypothetical protein